MIGMIGLFALMLSAQAQAAPDTVAARRTMHAFGACAADQSAEKASETLVMDFTTSSYRLALRNLGRANESCLRNGRMRAGGLLFAGAMAERLLMKDAVALNVRLARAAAGPAPTPRTRSDRVAICVVRSAPDDVAKLFAAPVASEEEAAAARALNLPATLCAEGGPQVEASVDGLRAMLATAAFRTVQAGEAGN